MTSSPTLAIEKTTLKHKTRKPCHLHDDLEHSISAFDT